jgi:hypothetical protein
VDGRLGRLRPVYPDYVGATDAATVVDAMISSRGGQRGVAPS